MALHDTLSSPQKNKNRFLVSSLALAISASVTGSAFADVIFSEYVEGSGYNKAIELYNTGTEQVDLSNYTVRLHTNGVADNPKSLSLSGKSLDAGKVLVIAHSSASDVIKAENKMIDASITNFNGNDSLVLVQGETPVDAIGIIGDSTDFGKDKTLARKEGISTGSTTFDLNDWNEFKKDDFDGLGHAPGTRVPVDKEDDGDTIDPGPSFGSCAQPGDELKRITDIQKLEFDVNKDGIATNPQYVLVKGIVTQVTASGYFIQQFKTEEEQQDKISSGIYVYDNINRPKVGERIYLKAKATKYKNMTQLTGVKPSELNVCASNMPIPGPVYLTMPVSEVDLDQYEGMQVEVAPVSGESFYVTDTFSLSHYGQIKVSSGAPRAIPTDKHIPGSNEAIAIKESNAKNSLTIEDGFSGKNPETISYYPEFSHDKAVRIGSRVENTLNGGLYRFGDDFQLVQVDELQLDESEHPRIQEPASAPANTIRIASFNVLNYFNGYAGKDGNLTPDDAKYWEHSINGNARGATSKEEFATQREKIITAISRINADVVGILEMENDGWDNDSAIHDLVIDGINKVSNKTYDYIRTDADLIGTDVIKVSLIYNKDAVEPAGKPVILTEYPFDKDTKKHRPPMIQTFKEKATGKEFTVAINHFKSKGSSCSAMGDKTDEWGQGNCNRMRVTAAETLGKYLDAHYQGKDVLLVGDLNAYGMEDPVLLLTQKDKDIQRTLEKITHKDGKYTVTPTAYRMDFVNLGPKFIKEDYFSYAYGGEVGSLDHGLASPSLASKVKQVQDWNINAGEPTGMDYTTSDKPQEVQDALIVAESPFRSSDHNPIMVDVQLGDRDSSNGNGDNNSGVNTGDEDDSGSMGWLTLGLGLLGLGGRRRKKKAA